MYLTNAFDLNSLPGAIKWTLSIEPIDIEEARCIAITSKSAVKDPRIAEIFSHTLGIDVQANHEEIPLCECHKILVGLYVGPTLSEDMRGFPKGENVKWKVITLERD